MLPQKIVPPPQRVSENKGLVISAVNAVQKYLSMMLSVKTVYKNNNNINGLLRLVP
jgi:hypothetical protein|tara:strand:+ start:622 stop:789 length:168 start_codon:yes stop_codon:yes gene_type:complete